MTLRGRLLFASLILSLATTLALALVVRDSWQKAEENRFREEFERALSDIEAGLRREADRIRTELEPLCAHDPIVDSALVGFRSGSVSSRLLSIRARVPELSRSLGLDELVLVDSGGTILGGASPHSGSAGPPLARLVDERSREPKIRTTPPIAFEAACKKEEGGVWVALLAATHLEPVLAESGRAHDLSLTLLLGARSHDGQADRGAHVGIKPLAFLPGAVLRAERSRGTLQTNLEDLDSSVLTAAGGTLLFALLLAFFLSRGLSKPVVQFAERTREAMQGTVRELPVSGGPELEQAARAFNATLADLQALRERLKLTERIAARREVARQIAHEIKNPLSPIRTSIETLRKMKERQLPEFEEYFDETTRTVLSEVARISNLVGHFAKYASVPSPKPTRFLLEDAVERVVELHQGLGAEVRMEASGRHQVLADEGQVAQVLTNLVKNAIEATEGCAERRVAVTVAERPESRGEILLVSVEDSGPGLRPDQVDKIFEPYVTTKKEGTGLGLPISHRIAVEHGGDLTYTTPPQGGAQFVFSLPVNGPPTLAEPSD